MKLGLMQQLALRSRAEIIATLAGGLMFPLALLLS
jgi:hypothetical protein